MLDQISNLDPFELLSFAEMRMRKKQVIQLLPELADFDQIMEFCTDQNLMLEMEAHNRTVRRGMKMGLIKTLNTSNLQFSSAFDYLVHMRGSKLAQALQALCTFGERIAPKVVANEHARLWEICDSIVITQERWYGLCLHMLIIATDLHRTLASASSQRWPDRHLLEQVWARINATYGCSMSAVQHMIPWYMAAAEAPRELAGASRKRHRAR